MFKEFLMNYLKIYNDLCRTRFHLKNNRLKLKDSGCYFEHHHIKPRCIDGKNIHTNIVLLTAREHFIAHYLLYRVAMTNKINKTKKKSILCSFVFMKAKSSTHKNKYFNSKLYEQLKLNFSKSMTGDKNHFYGKTHSIESRKKMSDCKIGSKNHYYGRSHSDKTKQKISDAVSGVKNVHLGSKHSESTKEKMSNARSFVKKIKCKNCKKEFYPNNIKLHSQKCAY